MISTELSMIQMLDPQRHELALLQAAWLEKGGTIEVLAGPSFKPPPERHEPPPRKKTTKARRIAPKPTYLDRMAQRDIEREERSARKEQAKAELLESVRALAETLTYAQAECKTGLARRTLQRLAVEGGFKFRPAINNRRPQRTSEADDLKNAERIRAFKEIGISRYQAMSQLGVTFKTFNRLLEKFGIDYPKATKGPELGASNKKAQD
ncbi:hypothetical protein M3M50_10620 [Pseudomonas bijieensis]|uniref:hypothetical protein n=1 Tax=Pseudomonas bijieensis TaxID=2681983 RepID=UPI00200F3A37|nr:hypothetical protein [Pseudomonas bijieensis]UQI33051.1 hypothetical protein M3M50_10620 [Pseudomonas bijieensis]